jgi:hypothetical protein
MHELRRSFILAVKMSMIWHSLRKQMHGLQYLLHVTCNFTPVVTVVDRFHSPFIISLFNMWQSCISVIYMKYTCIDNFVFIYIESFMQQAFECSHISYLLMKAFFQYEFLRKHAVFYTYTRCIRKFLDCYCCNCICERRWEGGQGHTSTSAFSTSC